MLAEDVKELEERCKKQAALIKVLENKVTTLKLKKEEYKKLCEMVIPEKVYVHKERKNTTVKFRDGSSITVTRKQDEKDCLETAIAYCLLKQILSPADVKELINEKKKQNYSDKDNNKKDTKQYVNELPNYRTQYNNQDIMSESLRYLIKQ